ncbi:unnamed protein product [Clonostachys byssicola]|uniref:Xylanolytic transcriptional activator regulatory domain-containing protein n=1 Tax=Clonostachys byssicola TaxID=160290 RepID=A0A9N9Y775_9HYPO|nr:unnamed protein product [Clonostachys byssicola]
MGHHGQVPLANPSLPQIRQLWATYVRNVDPLMKVVHKPSVELALNDLASRQRQVDEDVHTLLLSICYAGIVSLPAIQARTELALDISSLAMSFKESAERGFMKVQILQTTNFTVLQAFVIFLSYQTCLPRTEAGNIAALTALAVRTARRMKLHDERSLEKLTPFEAEMRRRLWWQLCLLDWRVSEDARSEVTISQLSFDTRMPANIDDDEFGPASTDIHDRQGSTEMTFSLMRFETWLAIAGLQMKHLLPGKAPSIAEDQQAALDKLFVSLDHSYLRQCRHLSTPIARLLSMLTPLAVDKLRLLSCFSSYDDITKGVWNYSSTLDRDKIFQSSIDLLDLEHMMDRDDDLRHWRWFVKNNHIQWHAMSFALSELRICPGRQLEGKAWETIEKCFSSTTLDCFQGSQSNIWSSFNVLRQEALDARLLAPGSIGGSTLPLTWDLVGSADLSDSSLMNFDMGWLHDVDITQVDCPSMLNRGGSEEI